MISIPDYTDSDCQNRFAADIVGMVNENGREASAQEAISLQSCELSLLEEAPRFFDAALQSCLKTSGMEATYVQLAFLSPNVPVDLQKFPVASSPLYGELVAWGKEMGLVSLKGPTVDVPAAFRQYCNQINCFASVHLLKSDILEGNSRPQAEREALLATMDPDAAVTKYFREFVAGAYSGVYRTPVKGSYPRRRVDDDPLTADYESPVILSGVMAPLSELLQDDSFSSLIQRDTPAVADYLFQASKGLDLQSIMGVLALSAEDGLAEKWIDACATARKYGLAVNYQWAMGLLKDKDDSFSRFKRNVMILFADQEPRHVERAVSKLQQWDDPTYADAARLALEVYFFVTRQINKLNPTTIKDLARKGYSLAQLLMCSKIVPGNVFGAERSQTYVDGARQSWLFYSNFELYGLSPESFDFQRDLLRVYASLERGEFSVLPWIEKLAGSSDKSALENICSIVRRNPSTKISVAIYDMLYKKSRKFEYLQLSAIRRNPDAAFTLVTDYPDKFQVFFLWFDILRLLLQSGLKGLFRKNRYAEYASTLAQSSQRKQYLESLVGSSHTIYYGLEAGLCFLSFLVVLTFCQFS